MDDAALLAHINDLVAEEQKLVETPDHDPARLSKLEVTLDQCWDLLRQRRAKREFGLDPEVTSVHDPDTVEKPSSGQDASGGAGGTRPGPADPSRRGSRERPAGDHRCDDGGNPTDRGARTRPVLLRDPSDGRTADRRASRNSIA